MPDVVLARVAFIPESEQDELENKIIALLKDFEKKHKDISTFAEIEIIKKQ